MMRFMVLTFGLLGVAWYQMSGGSEFKPGGTSPVAASPLVRVVPIEPATTAADDTQPVIVAASLSAPAQAPVLASPAVVVPQPAVEPVAATVETPIPDDTPNAVTVTVVEPALSQQPATSRQPELATQIEDAVQGVTLVGRPDQAVNPEDELFRDIRVVTGSRVNLRSGPGTGFGIQGKLYEGDKVEVVDETGDGWVKIRIVGDGSLGWMADWLITAANTE